MAWRENLARNLEWAVVAAALASIPVIVLQEQDVSNPLLPVADWLLWSVFAVEYAALLAIAPDRRHQASHSLFSAAIVVLSFPLLPELFAFIRLARLARLARILLLTARAMRAVSTAAGNSTLVSVAFITILLIVGGGGAFALIEPEKVTGGFWDGVWWGLVTAATVGYGDVVPATLEGRVIAAIVMVAGIASFSTLSATLAAHFVSQSERRELADLREQLTRIEKRLGDG